MKAVGLFAIAVIGGLVGAGAARLLPDTGVRSYLLANPEIIPEAMAKLQERESNRSVAALRPALTTPFAGASAGNPQGDVTVVEFYDYNCGYCRANARTVRQLIAGDPKVRVVFRELPILAESSRTAARVSLLAASQGKFNRFHDALFAGGRVTDASIAAAARTAGVDTTRLASLRPKVEAELQRNFENAGRLGINGVPGWVIGDRIYPGALSLDDLKRAVAAARQG